MLNNGAFSAHRSTKRTVSPSLVHHINILWPLLTHSIERGLMASVANDREIYPILLIAVISKLIRN